MSAFICELLACLVLTAAFSWTSIHGDVGSCDIGKFGWSCSLSCHCSGGDVCDTNGDCPNGCDLQWAGPTCQLQLENVAQGKEATQGPETMEDRGAEYAVDGITNQTDTYSHSLNRKLNSTAWWQVDLGGVQKIRTIKVLFPEPVNVSEPEEVAYEKKLREFSIKVSNLSDPLTDGDLCYEDHSGSNTSPTTIILSDCSHGSHVGLYNSRYDTQNQTVYSKWPHLLITEVKVIAETDCAARSYGSQCQSVCGHCKDGTYELMLIVQLEAMDLSVNLSVAIVKMAPTNLWWLAYCAAGSYGSQCQYVCGHCKDGSCTRDDGSCDDCVSGWYGSNCNQQCSPYCSSAGCVKDTGYCTDDCASGYHSSHCNLTCSSDCKQGCQRLSGQCNSCPGNKYGPFCEEVCSSSCNETNCSGRICDRDTGHCLCGCKEKKFGDSCDQSCPSNCIVCQNYSSCSICEKQNWGDRCDKRCTIDCLNQDCDKSSGKCHGCTGDSKYGDMCAVICPSNCVGGLCHQNGTCRQGCQNQSLYGSQCDTPCSHSIPSCKECQSIVECTMCKDGKYGKSCERECPLNCAECTDASTCTQCEKGFTGLTCDTKCSVPDCSSCAVDGTCDFCIPGKYGRNCAFKCPKCKTCILDETAIMSNKSKCLTCHEGSFLFRNKNRHLCIKCDDKCKACVSGENCTSCKDGYHGRTCQSDCPDTCHSCLSDTDCTRCKTGWTGSVCQCNLKNCITDSDPSQWCAAGGTCLKGCSKGYFGDSCDAKCYGNCTKCEQKSGICSECVAGSYGRFCVEKCSSNCAEKDFGGISICDFQDGSCSGCEYGLYGPKCEKSCNPNCLTLNGNKGCNQNDGTCEKCWGDKYGPTCELDCPLNCHSRTGDSSCSKDNGQCVGCIDGYYGVNCNMSCSNNCKTSCEQSEGICDECKSGYYGRFCGQKCSSDCGRGKESKMIACNRLTGECFCKEGYHGEICNHECSTNCAVGSNKPDCKKADGHCHACIPGRHGHFCDGKCNENCGIADGGNGVTGLCDRNTSLCLHGCAKGWFSFTCLERCNSKCRGETCNHDDGKCSDGCVSGYQGDYCNLIGNQDTVPDDTLTAGVVGVVIGAVLAVIIVLVILFFVRKQFFHKPDGEDSNTKVYKSAAKTGISSNENIPLYDYVDGASSLPPPAHNTPEATAEDKIATDEDYLTPLMGIDHKASDYSMPLMGSDHKASDYYNLSSQIPMAGDADFIHGKQAADIEQNSFPPSAQNVTKATIEEETAGVDDYFTPLMGGDHEVSDYSMALMGSDHNDSYYNLSSQILVAGFADYVHRRQAANIDWYKADFAKLPRGLLKNCLVALSPVNRRKCRYKNLYPYDDSRVILEPDGNEKTDFINASYIHGYQKKEAFIAAQGPTEQTANDFWRMIWQKNCGKIVMLTNLYEDCKVKCIKYWPDAKETQCYGNLDIEKVAEKKFSDYTLRHFKATHKRTREEKDFKHFHFTAWPDQGVPENAGSMLHFRDMVNEAEGVPDGPMLVHCSTGSKQTGAFIVIDYLLRQAKAESHIDVIRTVTDMRYQRANFVQTDEQYDFCHRAVSEYLDDTQIYTDVM